MSIMPNMMVKAFIDELQVFCSNRLEGCTWTGRLDTKTAHEETCACSSSPRLVQAASTGSPEEMDNVLIDPSVLLLPAGSPERSTVESGEVSTGRRNAQPIREAELDRFWQVGTPLPRGAGGTSAASVVNGTLFALGGFDSNCTALACTHRYDVLTDAWVTSTPLPIPCRSLRSAEVNGRLYATGRGAPQTIGGSGAATPADAKNLVWSLDQQRGWVKIVAPSTRRIGFGMVSIDGALYTIGGWDVEIDDVTRNVERLDPRTSSWHAVAGLRTARDGIAAAILDRDIYAMGGDDDLSTALSSSVERFDTRVGRWVDVAPLRTPRRNLAAAVLDRRLYAVGGLSDISGNLFSSTNRMTNIVEVFCPESGAWTTVAELPTARAEFAMVPFHGTLFAIGGNHMTGLQKIHLNTVDCYASDGFRSRLQHRNEASATLPEQEPLACEEQDQTQQHGKDRGSKGKGKSKHSKSDSWDHSDYSPPKGKSSKGKSKAYDSHGTYSKGKSQDSYSKGKSKDYDDYYGSYSYDDYDSYGSYSYDDYGSYSKGKSSYDSYGYGSWRSSDECWRSSYDSYGSYGYGHDGYGKGMSSGKSKGYSKY